MWQIQNYIYIYSQPISVAFRIHVRRKHTSGKYLSRTWIYLTPTAYLRLSKKRPSTTGCIHDLAFKTDRSVHHNSQLAKGAAVLFDIPSLVFLKITVIVEVKHLVLCLHTTINK